MREEIILDIAELIQDYFAWVVTHPIDAAKLDSVETHGVPGTVNIYHSDLLGFSKWLARNSGTPPTN